MKVLIIEDERKIASFIKQGLKSEGFTVETARDGETGLFQAQQGRHDLIILDLILPALGGVELCQKLRAGGDRTPIIMLTARDAVEDRIAGLNAGADDYLTKPFSFEELLARINAILRRRHAPAANGLKAGDLTLDPETFSVSRAGRQIELSPTEFKLLQFLMLNQGKPVSKTKILENVWEYDFSPESNIVDVYIKYLRDKINRGFKTDPIQTIRGIGYKLCG